MNLEKAYGAFDRQFENYDSGDTWEQRVVKCLLAAAPFLQQERENSPAQTVDLKWLCEVLRQYLPYQHMQGDCEQERTPEAAQEYKHKCLICYRSDCKGALGLGCEHGKSLVTQLQPAEPDVVELPKLEVAESDLRIGICAADTAMELATDKQKHAYIKNAVAELECRERQLFKSLVAAAHFEAEKQRLEQQLQRINLVEQDRQNRLRGVTKWNPISVADRPDVLAWRVDPGAEIELLVYNNALGDPISVARTSRAMLDSWLAAIEAEMQKALAEQEKRLLRDITEAEWIGVYTADSHSQRADMNSILENRRTQPKEKVDPAVEAVNALMHRWPYGPELSGTLSLEIVAAVDAARAQMRGKEGK